jgi:Spy/CpxP family protein refolding chaperone
MKKTLIAVALVATLNPLGAGAQGNPGRVGRRGMLQQQGPPPDSVRRNRQQMEGQVGRRVEERMKTLLNLTDAQMVKVREINVRYQQRRQMLGQQERDIRMSLREEAIGADSTRQAQVDDLLKRLMTAMRQRIDLLEQEQKDLSTVLTPLQRATYMGIEEQMRMQIERARMQQQGGRMGPPPDGQPQGPPDGARRPLRRPPEGVVPPA